MKNRAWIIIFAAVILVCAALSWLLLAKEPVSSEVGVYHDGELLRTIDLAAVAEPYTFTVTGNIGTNTVCVEPGSVYVASADCPDKTCIRHGPLGAGAPIVCLPNRVVIRWMDAKDVPYDAIVGAAG